MLTFIASKRVGVLGHAMYPCAAKCKRTRACILSGESLLLGLASFWVMSSFLCIFRTRRITLQTTAVTLPFAKRCHVWGDWDLSAIIENDLSHSKRQKKIFSLEQDSNDECAGHDTAGARRGLRSICLLLEQQDGAETMDRAHPRFADRLIEICNRLTPS